MYLLVITISDHFRPTSSLELPVSFPFQEGDHYLIVLLYISQHRCLSITHPRFHPLAWSSLECNLSIAYTALEPPTGNFQWLLSTHWSFHIGLTGLESSPLDQRLYYVVNCSVLNSIFVGLSEPLFVIRNIGYIQGSINTRLQFQEF